MSDNVKTGPDLQTYQQWAAERKAALPPVRVQAVVVPLHSCTASARVTKCDNVTDEWTCSVCGKTWTRPCNFDDDYS
jgi:hypothetical protein